MKKILAILALMMLLSGCRAETFETVNDDIVAPVMGQSKQIQMALPADAAVGAANTDGGRIYWCDGYDIVVQTLAGGDITRTVKTLSGFDMNAVPVIQTQLGGIKRYEWVWCTAAEGGDQVNRAVVLAEGDYHYCVALSAAAEEAGALEAQWSDLLSGIVLV